MKARFLELAEENEDFPIGAGNWLRLHPEDRVASPYRSWTFGPNIRRMPEFAAPGVGRQSTTVDDRRGVRRRANGVLYAVGGAGGGLDGLHGRGELVYEYNMMIIENYQARTAQIPAGKHRIVIDTTIAKPGGPADVVITVDGAEAARTTVARTVPAAFTATESFDVGVDLGSPVSQAYADRRPFPFDGSMALEDLNSVAVGVGNEEEADSRAPSRWKSLIGPGARPAAARRACSAVRSSVAKAMWP